jgi:hypothetical protein
MLMVLTQGCVLFLPVKGFMIGLNCYHGRQGGTLIHESTHFAKLAGTDDHAYGQKGAKTLAVEDPDTAIDNADSHEYFAENNPHLD